MTWTYKRRAQHVVLRHQPLPHIFIFLRDYHPFRPQILAERGSPLQNLDTLLALPTNQAPFRSLKCHLQQPHTVRARLAVLLVRTIKQPKRKNT